MELLAAAEQAVLQKRAIEVSQALPYLLLVGNGGMVVLVDIIVPHSSIPY